MRCSTLWPFFGPPDFHKTVEASNGKTQEQYIPSSQEGWRLETCHRPASPEQVHPETPLQDGVSIESPRFYHPRRLSDEDRPEGCLPGSPYSPVSQTFSAFPMERQELPMCYSTLWPFFGPLDFHKTVEASNGKTQEFGCEAHGIHRRYPFGSSLGSSSQQSHQDSSRAPSEFGVCHQLEEIQFGTRTNTGISGVNCGLQADELFLTREKVSKIGKEARHFLRQSQLTLREGMHLIGLMSATLPAVLEALLHFRALQNLVNEAVTKNLPLQSQLLLDSGSRKDLQWWTTSLLSASGRPLRGPQSRYRDGNRCLPQEVGSSDGHSESRRSLDGQRGGRPHQPTGAEGSGV